MQSLLPRESKMAHLQIQRKRHIARLDLLHQFFEIAGRLHLEFCTLLRLRVDAAASQFLFVLRCRSSRLIGEIMLSSSEWLQNVRAGAVEIDLRQCLGLSGPHPVLPSGVQIH